MDKELRFQLLKSRLIQSL